MKLINKLTTLVNAMTRGTAPSNQPQSTSLPVTHPSEAPGEAATTGSGSQQARPVINRELEQERVADLLRREQKEVRRD